MKSIPSYRGKDSDKQLNYQVLMPSSQFAFGIHSKHMYMNINYP